MVNRVWQHLFGRGLVSSVDNFGVTGDVPSHPELLDYLAARFVRDGWSVKRLIRGLVLTRAYRPRLGGRSNRICAVDPDNRLVWRHSPRRLEAEELRDAALAAAGMLDPAPAEGSPARKLQVVELRNNGPKPGESWPRPLPVVTAASTCRWSAGSRRDRSRCSTSPSKAWSPAAATRPPWPPRRCTCSTTPFVRRQALALAERLLARDAIDDAERINWAYRLTLGRTGHFDGDRTGLALPGRLRTIQPRGAVVAVGCGLAAGRRGGRRPGRRVNARGGSGQGEGRMPQATSSRTARSRTRRSPPPKADKALAADDVEDEPIQPATPRAAAWASFCQALFGSAEFRYLP